MKDPDKEKKIDKFKGTLWYIEAWLSPLIDKKFTSLWYEWAPPFTKSKIDGIFQIEAPHLSLSGFVTKK